MITAGNTPANPVPKDNTDAEFWGLTKREYFAAMALQGILAANKSMPISEIGNVGKVSAFFADELIEALNEEAK